MKRARLVETRTISLEGLKPNWVIKKPEDIRYVGGQAFIRFASHMAGLVQLATCDNPHAPNPVPKNWTLSGNIGLSHMIAERNKQQAKAMADSEGAACSLFDSPQRKRQPKSRAVLEQLRKSPEIMTLEIHVYGKNLQVDVLRPVVSNDNLFVACDEQMLGAVLNYIRSSGFEERQPRSVSKDLPRGIQRRGGAFVVKYVKPEGAIGWKRAKTMDDAVAFLADPYDQDSSGDERDLADEAQPGGEGEGEHNGPDEGESVAENAEPDDKVLDDKVPDDKVLDERALE